MAERGRARSRARRRRTADDSRPPALPPGLSAGRRLAEHRRRLVRLGAPPQELPDRPAFWVNQIFQFHGHRWIYDHEELRYALRQAGFPANGVVDRPFREGAVPAMAMLDRAVRDDETLYVEARSDPA